MHDRDQIKIDVISGIDEEIVDRNTQKRFELEERIGKKRPIRWIPIVAAAASFFIIAVSILWLIPIFTKQVPVYQGMTVSGAPLTEQVAANTEDIPKINVFELFGDNFAPVQSISLSRVGAPIVLKNGDNGNHYGNDKDNKAESTDSSTISGIGGPDSIYYAEPNEDIYITIHISNPDEYEILSFTLNGEKYSSYMFEQGSDMEHLILKKNVGDAEGVIEYTIDAIKYVDGTEIKDVRMDGDRTVKVGVYTEEQPKAKIEKLTADFNTLSFDISFKDKMNLITLSGGSVKAILYCGEEEIEEKEIALGEEQHIEFKDLELDTEYRYVIEATYDNLSGDGVAKHVLAEGTVRTLQPLKFDSVTVTQESIEFELVWHEKYQEKEVKSLGLYQNGEKIKELSVSERKLEGLLSDNNYTIKATYINEDEEKAVELSVHTEAKAVPSFEFVNVDITDNSISGEYTVTDMDNILSSYKLEVYKGEELIYQSTERDFELTVLDYYTKYTFKISYRYDLNDGSGVQSATYEHTLRTLPHIDVTDIKILNTSAIFQGDTVFAQLTVDNPLNMTVNTVTVNGVECIATNISNTQILVDIVCDGDGYAGGNTELRIEKVNVSINGESFSSTPKAEHSATVFIYGEIKVIKMEWVNEDFETVYYSSLGERYYGMYTLENPTGYVLKSANIGSGTYELIKIDDNRWYYVPNTIETLPDGLSYYVGEEIKTISCEGISPNCYYVPYGAETRYISTAEDLKNIGRYGYYVLTNDIDLAGVQWEGGDFYGVFDGNGYKIKNMTILGSAKNENFYCGLFRQGSGAIKNLTLENVNIMVSVTAGSSVYIGGFVGYAYGDACCLILDNCTVSGNSIISVTIETKAECTVCVGGLIGRSSEYDTVIQQCTNNADIKVISSTAKGSVRVGGLVGSRTTCDRDIVKDSVNTGDIQINLSCYAYVGGVVGQGENLNISNFLNSGNILFDSSSTVYEGAFVGYGNPLVENSVNIGNMSSENNFTEEQLNSKEFYTETLGWSEDIWDFSELDVANGKYPKLK